MAETLNGLLENFEKNAALVDKSNGHIKQSVKKLSDKLETDKSENNKIMDKFKKYNMIESNIIKLNVGGALFSTTKSTLIKKIKDKETDNFHQPNVFEGILNGYIEIKYDENKAIFIDRNPKYFGYILDYLRMAGTENEFELPPGVDKDCLNKEAKFFNLRGLFNLTMPVPKSAMMKLFDSKILNEKLTADFLRVCQFLDGQKFELLYRASQDGFEASSFHSKCDYLYKTITIVKSRNGNIFGGYTDQCWDQSGKYKLDNNAFIFSLVNLHESPIKIACSPGKNAIYCSYKCGPTFGSGHDFHIASESNSNQSSYLKLSTSYILPSLIESKDRSDYYYELTDKEIKKPNRRNKSIKPLKFLAGSFNFYVDEIEVFQCL